MAKMNKEQIAKFNNLFETTLKWGNDSNCTGLFSKLLTNEIEETHNLYYLATCVQEEDNQIEILEFKGEYFDFVGYVPINSKTKIVMKNIVNCLLDGGSFKDVSYTKGVI